MVAHNGEQGVGGGAVRRDEWWDITESTVLVEGNYCVVWWRLV